MPTILPTPTAPHQPNWTSPLDEEGQATGPHSYVGNVGVLTGWNAEEGPFMWLDTTGTRGTTDLTPNGARSLAAALNAFATLVEQATPVPADEAEPVAVPAA